MTKPVKTQAKRPMPPRLPKGSSFLFQWDGEEWSGVLVVPDFRPFEAKANTLFTLAENLDWKFRRIEKQLAGKKSAVDETVKAG